MESTIGGEVVVTWRSQASFDDHDDDAYSTTVLSCRRRWNLKFKPKIDGHDDYSTAILSCRQRWKHPLKPKIDGYKIPIKRKFWSIQMV